VGALAGPISFVKGREDASTLKRVKPQHSRNLDGTALIRAEATLSISFPLSHVRTIYRIHHEPFSLNT
jgi:hypothetical protein